MRATAQLTWQPQRCLIVGPSWVGDMIMAQSLFILLKQRFPTLSIDVLAPAWSEPLLAAMPEVRTSIVLPVQHGELALMARYRLAKKLREQKYDWAILLPNSFKSALIPFWAHIPYRTGFRGEWRYGVLNDVRLLDKARLTTTVQRFVALGLAPDEALPEPIPHPSLQVAADDLTAIYPRFSLDPSRPLLALCPGAEYGAAKRWPAQHFAVVAKEMIAKGWQVVLLGSVKDAGITEVVMQEIASQYAEQCYDLAGKTSLKQAMTLLSVSKAVVSNDSGLMHLAAAVGSRVIAIYGSSDPTFTPPLSERASILYLGLDCSPCFKRDCPLGHLNCLQQILPAQVLAHLV